MSRKFFPRARRADTSNGKVDWQAKWIWSEGEPSPKNSYLHARRIFELKNVPENAVVRLTADSRYELYINGQYIGRGPVRSDPRYQTYDTYNVSSFLNKGKNTIAVLVHHYGDSTYSYVLGRGGLICQIELEQDGEKTIIGTDDTWRVYASGPWTQQGARMSRRLGFQEVYDARLDLGTWTEVKYNDRAWQPPKVLGPPPIPPWENLLPRMIPQLKEEQVYPVSILASAILPPTQDDLDPKDVPALMASEEFLPLKKVDISGETEISVPGGHGVKLKGARNGGKSVLIDFGREVSGRIRLDLTGYAGGVVDIGYSEKLENGRIDPSRSEVLYSDRLIMRAGRYTWTTFESRGFRYMQIDFRNIKRPVHLHSVSVVETLYPVEHRGHFESSDDMLNRIWAVGAETARLCMEDSFIDSPWRERGEWWADARVQSHVAYYAFGDTSLLAQGIRHIARTQRKDGAVMCMYPVPSTKIVPDFAALWVMSVWEYYAFTGDRGILFDLYPAVSRLLRWLNNFTDSDGLLSNVEGWNFVDWGNIDTEGEVTAINCFYYKALRRAEHMALVLNKGADADRWNELASLLKIAINKHLWSPVRGLFADSRVKGKIKDNYSRQTNILAVLFDVPDHYRKSSICRQMLNGDLPQISTPYFMGYLTDALFRMGYEEEALDIIRKRWGAMIEAGATTFWEHFTPSDSLCHGWSASPTRDLSAYVLGVQPVAGKRRIRIEPHTGSLKWARGAVPTPYGNVEVEWKQNRRDFVISFRIPNGLSCILDLPMAKSNAKVMVNGKEREGSAFELGSGNFTVKVKSVMTIGKSRGTIADRNAKESVVEYLSGHQLWRSEERRQRRRVRVGAEEPEEEHISDDEIEYVESIDEINPAMIAARAPQVVEEETPVCKKQSRLRRRRKSKVEVDIPGTVEETDDTAEVAEEPVVSEPEAVVEAVDTEAVPEAAVAEPAAEQPAKRRTRRGRRGRGKSRAAEAPEAVVDTVVEAAPVVEDAAVAEPVSQETVEEASVTAKDLVSEEVSTEPSVEAQTKRPRHRPRRRKAATAEPVESVQASETAEVNVPKPVAEAAVDVLVQPEPVEAVAAAVEPVKAEQKPRRGSGRRKAQEAKSLQVEETPAVPVEEPAAPVEVPQLAAEVAPEEKPAKPRRRTRTRKPASTAAAADTSDTVVDVESGSLEPAETVIEAPSSEEDAVPARPRRTYKKRRSKSQDMDLS